MKALKESINAAAITEGKDFENTVDDILAGSTVIYIDRAKSAISVSLKEAKGRAVTEPDTEVTVRGPREGFIEEARTNTILLRRKIEDANFKMEAMKIGKRQKQM